MSLPTIKRTVISSHPLVVMCALLTAVLFATPAQSQNFLVEHGTIRAGTNDPKPPVFRVRATKNKQIYDTVIETNKGLSYKIKAKGRCPEDHHLSRSTIQLFTEAKRGAPVIFPVNENNRSLGGNQGQDWNEYILDFPFLLPETSPVETCNAEVRRRVDAGQSLAAILQNGFTVFVANSYGVDLNIGCEKNIHLGFYEMPTFHAKATLPAEVHCMPTGYVPTQGAQPKPGQPLPPPQSPLTSITVVADPAETKGKTCPVYVNFRGRIAANPDGNFATLNTKYRFLGENNYQTDWLSVSVNRDEPRTVHGRRFIQAPTNDRGGTILAPGQKPKIPIYRGWMILEVQLPEGSKRSERVGFTVDCNRQPVPVKLKSKP